MAEFEYANMLMKWVLSWFLYHSGWRDSLLRLFVRVPLPDSSSESSIASFCAGILFEWPGKAPERWLLSQSSADQQPERSWL